MAEKFEKHRQPWKSDELQKLQTLAVKGKGLREIAKALNRSEESTKDKAKDLGIAIAKLR
jgi:DNA-binding NarL/FixJ family response regulator